MDALTSNPVNKQSNKTDREIKDWTEYAKKTFHIRRRPRKKGRRAAKHIYRYKKLSSCRDATRRPLIEWILMNFDLGNMQGSPSGCYLLAVKSKMASKPQTDRWTALVFVLLLFLCCWFLLLILFFRGAAKDWTWNWSRLSAPKRRRRSFTQNSSKNNKK